MIRWGIIICLFLAILTYFTIMPNQSYDGKLPPLSTVGLTIKKNLNTHVSTLSNEIGERNLIYYENLNLASKYIEGEFKKYGYSVSTQQYAVDKKSVNNLEAELKGNRYADEIIVIGAHYDSAIGTKGANDNASGVAATLEIARILSTYQPARTIRFVAFVNEEPPHFWRESMGSLVYAKNARNNDENIIAMFSLETIGYYSDEEGSQQYPFPLFNRIYPNRGNFIAFLSDLGSRKLLKKTLKIFREKVSFPSEGLSTPKGFGGANMSDNWSFWQNGYPAIMITDTAFMRYEYYHTSEDTHEKLDYYRMAIITEGFATVIKSISESDSGLSSHDK